MSDRRRDVNSPLRVWSRPEGGYLIRGAAPSCAGRIRKVGGKWNPELRGMTVTQQQWESFLMIWQGDRPVVMDWSEFELTEWTKPSLASLSAEGKSPGSSRLHVKTRVEPWIGVRT